MDIAEGTLVVICCDCRKVLKVKDGKGNTGVSHSYCDECYKTALKQIDEGDQKC